MKGRDGAQSREREISEISRGLKALAKELYLPVIALSQLNRAVETRSEKSEAPSSSATFVNRAPSNRTQTTSSSSTATSTQREATTEPNVAELIIAKQRNGPTGTVKCRFDHAYTRFDNLADGEFED